jgi:hypothetical protein
MNVKLIKGFVFIGVFLLSSLFTVAFSQQVKNISILGDSYSTFEGHIPKNNKTWYFKGDKASNDVTNVEEIWWYMLAEEMNYKLIVNNSYSGSTICNTGYKKEDSSETSFVTRMKNLGSPDIIFVFGATNDFWVGSPIGEFKFDDFNNDDLKSFRPAMAYMLSYLTTHHKKAEIYFILNSCLGENINQSINRICKYYDVPCIKLVDIDKQKGHPSVAGMRQIKEQIISFIK